MPTKRETYVQPVSMLTRLGPVVRGFHEDLTALETKVANLVVSGGGVSSYTQLTDRPDLSVYATRANPAFSGTVSFTGVTVTGLSAATVGLGNVTNTADSAKTWAASQVTTGVFNPARLGSGTRDASTVLHGDGVFRAPTGGGGAPAAPAGASIPLVIDQAEDGSWPTVQRVAGYSYQWWALYDDTRWPTEANGVRAGDKLVSADGTTVTP